MYGKTKIGLFVFLIAIFLFSNGSFADAAATNGAYPQMNNRKLAEYLKNEGKGKVVLVSVFASWCPPCSKEMPSLVKLSNNAPENLMVIGISNDSDMGELRRFLSRHSVEFPVFIGTESFFIENKIAAIPQLMVFNADGAMVEMIEGLIYEDSLINLVKEYTGHDYK